MVSIASESRMRRLIICGGRDQRLTKPMRDILLRIYNERGPFEIVHGGARGIDTDADLLFRQRLGIAPTVMRPKYEDYAPDERDRAPLDRNTAMAEYAGPDGVCIAFPGNGGGTWDMVRKAWAEGMIVLKWDMSTERLVRLKGNK